MQKKIIALLLPFLLGGAVASLCFVLSGYDGVTPKNTETTNTEGIGAENSEIPFVLLLDEWNVFAVDHPIEKAYLEGRANDLRLGITEVPVELDARYSELWKEEAETYANLFISWLDTDLGVPISFIKYWEHENDGVAERFYRDLALCLRDTDSDLRTEFAALQLDMFRLKAVKIIDLYDRSRMGSGWGWKYNWGLDSQTVD
jgi:hypothetical protein